jgi:hypothetical protein
LFERQEKAKRECGDKDLPAKFGCWKKANHQFVSNLVLSVLHPLVGRNRLESYVANITFEEVDSGFRAVSVKAVLVASLPKGFKHTIRESNKRNEIKDIISGAIFKVESASRGKNFVQYNSFKLGEWAILPMIRKIAEQLSLTRWQDIIVNELNQE